MVFIILYNENVCTKRNIIKMFNCKIPEFYLNYRIKMNCAISWIWNWFAGLALQVGFSSCTSDIRPFARWLHNFIYSARRQTIKKFHCKYEQVHL